MLTGSRIIQLVALTDMCLAISISCYVGFRISQGADLIPGNLTESEKVTRVIVYAILLYIFLGIQLYMAVRLMRTTRWPQQSLKYIGIWLEWSFVYLIFIVIHGATALLLMNRDQRKSIIMVLSSIQALFRISGILVVAKHHYAIAPPEQTRCEKI